MVATKTISNQDPPVQILVAEDSDINQKVARMMLEKEGFEVDIAADGRQAVTACKHGRYDLILMDISMPVMDGFAAAGRIREGESGTPRVPIIAMTGHAAESIRERCLEHGMDDCIGKPLQRNQLLAVVKKWTTAAANRDPAEAGWKKPGSTPRSGSVPVDLDRAKKEFMGNTQALFDLLNDFVGRAEQQIRALQQAFADNDYRSLSEQAHRIKGAAANLTAMRLAQTAAALELAADGQRPDQCAEVVAKLQQQWRQLDCFVRQNCSRAAIEE